MTTDDYDRKVEFEHPLGDGPNKGDMLAGSLHIVAETIIVHINEMEDAYIFTPMYDLPPDIYKAVTIVHHCAMPSEMKTHEGPLLQILQQWMAQFDEGVRTVLLPLIQENYTWLFDVCGGKADEAFGI